MYHQENKLSIWDIGCYETDFSLGKETLEGVKSLCIVWRHDSYSRKQKVFITKYDLLNPIPLGNGNGFYYKIKRPSETGSKTGYMWLNSNFKRGVHFNPQDLQDVE